MHDPLIVAFEIRRPWRDRPSPLFPKGWRPSVITIWHRDPETDGTDDSCGWFKRARHGDQEILKKIVREFAFDWCQSYGGWFTEEGKPRFTSMAIALMMFRRAAYEHFNHSWRRTDNFMKRHLYDILSFAENSTDSMHDGIVQRYGPEEKQERVNRTAEMVYGCILRWSQPWYRHPRWHVWHWRIQVHPWQQFRRRFLDRCSHCGRRFAKNEPVIGTWSGDAIFHQTCDRQPKVPQQSPS